MTLLPKMASSVHWVGGGITASKSSDSPLSTPWPRFFSSFFNSRTVRKFRMRMTSMTPQSSPLHPPPPENAVVLGCGLVTVDLLAAVASYPKPDEKILSTSFQVQGGGNAGNALTCAARLGLKPRLISKVAADSHGKVILEELEADGVDTSFIVVSQGGNSPFSYLIVDNQMKTRTCIHTRGHPPMIPNDLSKSNLLSAIDGARLVYFDERLPETALVIAQEANRRGIPILTDAESKVEGLDDLLSFSSYAVCSANFPQSWTGAISVPSAIVAMLLRLPNLKFAIVTLGEDGCVMIDRRSEAEAVSSEEIDVDDLLETLKQQKDTRSNSPTYISSGMAKLVAKGIGTVNGRLFVGTAEKIPPSEIVDTTGAGDAFNGAVLYAICANMEPEVMLPFAAQVAAISCRALGARAGLPYRADSRLAPFLGLRPQEATGL